MRRPLRGASTSDQPNRCRRRNGRGPDALVCTPPTPPQCAGRRSGDRPLSRLRAMHRLYAGRCLPCIGWGKLDASPGRRALAPSQAPRAGDGERRPSRYATGALSSCGRGPVSLRCPPLSGFSALATRMMQRQTEKLSRGYFPRAVFFLGLGFFVLPVLAGAASFFGRFGDTGSLLPWLAVPGCLRARIRSEAPSRPAGRSARRYRSASPPCQSMEPSRPRPETAIVNGCCKRARPAKVARRCVPLSLSRATAASRLSQQTTCQEKGSTAADQATPS